MGNLDSHCKIQFIRYIPIYPLVIHSLNNQGHTWWSVVSYLSGLASVVVLFHLKKKKKKTLLPIASFHPDVQMGTSDMLDYHLIQGGSSFAPGCLVLQKSG